MATPAAILTMLVKVQGAQAAAGQLSGLDKNARRAGAGLKATESSAKRSSRSFAAVGGAAKLAGIGLGAAGLAKGLSSAVSEYREAQKVGGQTTAVLKSTAGAAKVSAKEVQNLAAAISRKTGIDDEQIQASENMLLTFTRLRNETGKGNDIFNQATQVVTDMSVALGQSGKSSAIQLGKALNDPIKGITALRRVGVAFTADQQKQIETMVKSGDLLGAQKAILKELNTEFAGSAAAQATAGDKFKVSLGNLAEAAGAILVPQIDKAARVLTTLMTQMVQGVGVGGSLVSVFRTTGGVVGAVVGQISALVNGFRQGNVGAVLLVSVLGGLTAGFVAYKTIVLAAAAATRAMAGAQALLNLAMTANPIGIVIVGLVALGAALVVAYHKFATFRNIVNAVFGWLRSVWPQVLGILTGPIGRAAAIIIQHWGRIKSTFTSALAALKTAMSSAAGGLASAAGAMARALVGGFKAALNLAHELAVAMRDLITKAPGYALGVGRAVVRGIINGIRSAVGGIGDAIGGAVKGAASKIPDINPFGDGPGPRSLPSSKGGGGLMGAKAHMAPFAAVGARFGLRVSSGLRPGAVTSSGRPSHHATGNAIDLWDGTPGASPAKMRAFQALKRHSGQLAELIYTPGGAYSNGQKYTPTGRLAADHYDHIHVAFRGGGTGDGLGRMAGVGDGGGNAKKIWQFLIGKGFTPAQAAGILGNLNQESRFDPAAREAGGKGPGHGIAQWSFGRATALKNFAKKRGKPWSDLSTQLAFMMSEFAGSENAAYKAVKGAKSVAEAESAFGLKYERYGVMGDRSGGQFLKMFQGVGGKAGGGSTIAASTAVERVNPLDQKLANADVAIEQAKRGTIKVGNRKISSALQQVAALTGKRQVIGKRIRSIRKALKGKLSGAKRLALTQELSQRLSEHAQLGTDVKALRNPAADATAEIGGAGVEGGEAGDPNQPLIDAMNAAAEREQERLAAEKAHTDALTGVRDELKRQTDFAAAIQTTEAFQLKKYLADVLSGQIGGYGITPRSYTPGMGVAHRY